MDRLTLGLALEQKIMVLCNTLDLEHNPRGRKIRSALESLNNLSFEETGNNI